MRAPPSFFLRLHKRKMRLQVWQVLVNSTPKYFLEQRDASQAADKYAQGKRQLVQLDLDGGYNVTSKQLLEDHSSSYQSSHIHQVLMDSDKD